eukprot:EC685464.1.p1 GENE.EC685464.1~~EC685464.1.p1  ORF type:complete len:184 (+),score=47.14 EC685464.1:26-577(+)
MRISVACVAVLVLTLAVVTPTTVRADNSWDYLMLVARWPGTVCMDHPSGCSIPSNVTTFNIHGMWPQRNDGSYPADCDPSYPFRPSEILNLQPELTEYWTSFYGDSQWDFWAHEWTKHGTCALSSPSITSENSFFSSAVQSLISMNALGNLASAGITPSSTPSSTAVDFVNALQQTFGHKVQV